MPARRGRRSSRAVGRLKGLPDRFVRLVGGSRRRSRRTERILFALAAVVFAAAAAFAYRGLPEADQPIRWELLVIVALLGIPASIWSNAAEYRAMAHGLGVHVPLGRAVRITILSAGANLLPLPGGLLVRTVELRRHGVEYRGIARLAAVVGLIWAGTVAVLTGASLAGLQRDPVGVGLAALGAAGIGSAMLLLARRAPTGAALRSGSRILAVEVVLVAVAASRWFLVLVALHVDVDVTQALALCFGGVVATVTGVFPGGLGIREVATAVIGPLVGLPAAVAALAAVINRLLELVVLIPSSLTLLPRARLATAEPSAAGSPADPEG